MKKNEGDRVAERAQASQVVMSVRREVEGLRREVGEKEREWIVAEVVQIDVLRIDIFLPFLI